MSSPRRPPLLWALLAIIAAEFVVVAGYAAFLIVEILVDQPDSWPTAIALTVLVVLAAAWIGAIGAGLWNRAGWTRGAGIVWQVLQAAVGVGALQGAFAQPAWGWPLLAAALVAFVLLASRGIGRWLRPEEG